MKKCLNLKSVNVCSTALRNFAIFADRCRHLTEIDFCGTKITDVEIIQIVEKCPNLKSIALFGTTITTEGFFKIAEKCANLKHIFVNGNINKTRMWEMIEISQSLEEIQFGLGGLIP